jgi:hypothetical protein
MSGAIRGDLKGWISLKFQQNISMKISIELIEKAYINGKL